MITEKQLEAMVKTAAYAVILTYMVDNDLDFYNDDDLKDAFVEVNADDEHLTDEQLDEAVAFMRSARADIDI